MKVWSLPSLQSVQSWEDLRRFASEAITNFSQVLSNNVTFSDNMRCQVIQNMDLIPVNTDIAVSHNLGVVPIGFIVIKQSAFAIQRQGDQAWTADKIYIQTNVTSTVSFIVVGG